MDKEYMLLRCRLRQKELKFKYNKACQCKDIKGNNITEQYAAQIRYNSKRDLDILALVEYLLLTSKSVFIDDDSAIEGFDKLCEPTER